MVPQRAQLVQANAVTLPESTLALLGDAVATRVLVLLARGEQRFGTLHTTIGGSTKTVVARLKGLERAGLVTRTLYAEVPPRAVYRITDKGRELTAIVEGIADWERSWNQVA